MDSKYDYLKKKLLYQSNHRGCKETDMLFSKFASLYLDEMTKQELLDYEVILGQTDADIVAWVMGHDTVPETLQNNVMTKLLKITTI